MRPENLRALIAYLNRSFALIPTTVSEVETMRPIMLQLEGIASGQLVCEIKSKSDENT